MIAPRPPAPLWPLGVNLGKFPVRKVFSLLPLQSPGTKSKPRLHGLVAQLDRVLDYESRGRGFESSPVRHFPLDNL